MRKPFDVRGFSAVLYKEWIHVLRDRTTLILALLLPTLQLLIFGYAVNTKVEHISTAYYNEDRGPMSILALDALRSSQDFDLKRQAESRQQLEALIVAGRVHVAVDIPPNFTADVIAGRPAQLQVLIDGSDSTVAQEAFGASALIGQALAAKLRPQAAVNATLIDVRPRMLFNPSLRSANFLVPGLIGLIMQLITIFLMSLSIVGERERGTLDQLLVTPIGSLGIMLGKIVPYVTIGFVDFIGVLLAMVFIFQVPIAGSLPLLLALGLCFLAAALGLGLIVSAVAQTQLQAILMTFATVGPAVLLSGFIFERELMPPVMQWIGLTIPLTYFLEILRGIVLRGAGLDALWPQVLAMTGLGVFLIVAASIRFARTTS
jgi:ABC-2 type transport system permease protein